MEWEGDLCPMAKRQIRLFRIQRRAQKFWNILPCRALQGIIGAMDIDLNALNNTWFESGEGRYCS